ncbi:MAG: YdcF family protein, partial [Clostridia bacterium]|nr:YdcF family protein [Clostridia bacterium]
MKRKIASIIFILLSVWFMLPIFKGVLHIGMIYPVLVFLFLAAVLAFWDRVNVFFKKHKIVFCALFAAFVVGITAIVLPLGFMIAASVDTPPENATVIVLGCQVKGDKPSTMLRDRCRSALNFLNANPNSVCVASGGQGNGENISEAKAIFNFLTENGISLDRIYLDEKSTNTSENLSFSADIIT